MFIWTICPWQLSLVMVIVVAHTILMTRAYLYKKKKLCCAPNLSMLKILYIHLLICTSPRKKKSLSQEYGTFKHTWVTVRFTVAKIADLYEWIICIILVLCMKCYCLKLDAKNHAMYVGRQLWVARQLWEITSAIQVVGFHPQIIEKQKK